jgi:hypothetical protein
MPDRCDEPAVAAATECEAEFRLHGQHRWSPAYLTCGLDAGHDDLHWDRVLSVAWVPWSESEEQGIQGAAGGAR